jgi:hypothetical protein
MVRLHAIVFICGGDNAPRCARTDLFDNLVGSPSVAENDTALTEGEPNQGRVRKKSKLSARSPRHTLMARGNYQSVNRQGEASSKSLALLIASHAYR